MQSPGGESGPAQAPQVCTSCKTRKRKCDKALPKCSSCSKRNLICEYLRPEQAPESASTSISAPEHMGWDARFDSYVKGVRSIDFSTVLFLDPEILRHGQVEIPPTPDFVPTHVLHLVGDMNEILATASTFFEHIHSWMPFISKKRFYELYIPSSFPSRPDVVLLLLSLKLVAGCPPVSPRNPCTALYSTVKHFYLDVESSSIFSLPVLQAGVLLALYELGHAIYPAAFLSVGACARYAHAIGISASKISNARRVLTLVEMEERRRVWWAIVILDRFVSIGCPGRPFATLDPRLEDRLPADDAAWDQGIVKSDDVFTLSSPMTSHMSKFALLCQAARLLGQVLENVSSESVSRDNVWVQLDRTLQSMLNASLDVRSPDYDQISFIYSTLLALYTPWLHSDSVSMNDPDSDRAQRAIAVVEQVTETISTNLIRKQCFLGRSPEDMSPWGLYFAYHICRVHMQFSRHNSNSAEIVKNLRETFLKIDARWNAAGVYLQLLEAQEVISDS